MRLDGFSILIVDDESFIRETIREHLITDGASVIEADSSKKALELLKTNKIDLILTDISMPEATGLELLEQVRALEEKTPEVILMSGFSKIKDLELKELGARGFYAKDEKMQHLKDLIYEILV